MYVIHKSSDKSKEYVTEETLDEVFNRKIKKLMTQIKTQKVIHQDIECEKLLDELKNFVEGSIEHEVAELHYKLVKTPSSFFIYKIFNSTYEFFTLRYYSLLKDKAYDKIKKKVESNNPLT